MEGFIFVSLFDIEKLIKSFGAVDFLGMIYILVAEVGENSLRV